MAQPAAGEETKMAMGDVTRTGRRPTEMAEVDDGSGGGDVGLVPFDPDPLTVDRLEPGDLVFVRSEPTALGTLISELDGCAFSHVGVLAPGSEPTLLSARTDRHGGLRSPDFGGVRRNALEDLVERGLFVAPLALDPAVREAGMARMAAWEERDAGPDRESRSRFSYAKLVVVSAGLAAVRRRRPLGIDAAEVLWDAVLEAADVLRWEGDEPAFYCAEAVAAAYGLELTVDALWVREGEPHPAGIVPPVVPGDEGEDVMSFVDLRDAGRTPSRTAVRERLDDVREVVAALGYTARQGFAVVRLLVTLWRYDPNLADRLVEAARELRDPNAAAATPHGLRPLPPGPFAPPPFVAGSTTPLPPALVTPRMLLSPDVVASVHPLRL